MGQTAMTRRRLLASLSALPLVRALDWVKVTVQVDGGRERVWWEPRQVAAKRFRRALATPDRNRH